MYLVAMHILITLGSLYLLVCSVRYQLLQTCCELLPDKPPPAPIIAWNDQ